MISEIKWSEGMLYKNIKKSAFILYDTLSLKLFFRYRKFTGAALICAENTSGVSGYNEAFDAKRAYLLRVRESMSPS
jgi:hypothetical protein